jgi:hypothetical protein
MVYHISCPGNKKMKKGGNPNPQWKPSKSVAYDRTPVQLKVLPGVRERLKSVDGWQDRIRQFIDELLAEEGD